LKHFKAIAAMSQNRVIGDQGKIPWYLPDDFKWFKQMTIGHVIVMGRKTFESLGRPLPGRKNLVLTRHPRKLIKQHPEIFGQFQEWRGGKSRGDLLKSAYQFHFHLRRRADLRGGFAALLGPLPDSGKTRRPGRRLLSAI
jgi:dihydrofolate reductase